MMFTIKTVKTKRCCLQQQQQQQQPFKHTLVVAVNVHVKHPLSSTALSVVALLLQLQVHTRAATTSREQFSVLFLCVTTLKGPVWATVPKCQTAVTHYQMKRMKRKRDS